MNQPLSIVRMIVLVFGWALMAFTLFADVAASISSRTPIVTALVSLVQIFGFGYILLQTRQATRISGLLIGSFLTLIAMLLIFVFNIALPNASCPL